MPQLSSSVPKYRKHRASGQAVVTLNGHDHYLGPHGTKASRIDYDRLVAEWLASGRQLQPSETTSLTIVEAVARYWRHVRQYYVKHGQSTGEQAGVRSALRRVLDLYADTEASEFSPLGLKAVRDRMVTEGLARTTINQHASRIRRMFKWLAAEQLVPAAIYHSLLVVDGLRKGRTAARETEPVRPVSDAVVEATLRHLPEVLADMVRFQRCTGCRPEEVCMLRPQDLDRSEEVWRYIPQSHKVEHHDCQRVIFVGPKAQTILLRYLARNAEAYCFRPVDSEAKRRADRHARRVVPHSCGTKPGDRRTRDPKRSPGDRYTTDSYRRAIERACNMAFPPPEHLVQPQGETVEVWLARLTASQRAELKAWQTAHRWTPNQLRHASGTEIRKRFGVEAARVCLGHTKIATTELYSERDYGLAANVARKIG